MEGGPPSFPRDFPSPVVLRSTLGSRCVFAYGAFTLCGWPFQSHSANAPVFHSLGVAAAPRRLSTTRHGIGRRTISRTVWAVPFRRHTSRHLGDFFSWPIRCSVPAVPSHAYGGDAVGLPPGFPHSGIPGSTPGHGSPRAIAVSQPFIGPWCRGSTGALSTFLAIGRKPPEVRSMPLSRCHPGRLGASSRWHGGIWNPGTALWKGVVLPVK